jgi:hypothetical protein
VAQPAGRNLRYQAKTFRLDPQEGQKTRLVVMCEAAGMAPQLADAVDEYGAKDRPKHECERALRDQCACAFTEAPLIAMAASSSSLIELGSTLARS